MHFASCVPTSTPPLKTLKGIPNMKTEFAGALLVGLCMAALAACASFAETPGERFRKAIKEIEAACAKRKLDPYEVCGQVAKLKPANPLATEEGRFAHSIKIPNPVPADSGYRPGMTPEQYFEHLCKNEAGEFIYKTVENVEGFYLMRPRRRPTDSEMEHLYGLEAPYQEVHGEYNSPQEYFVQPHIGKYQFLEAPSSSGGYKYHRYYRDENAHLGRDYQTAIDGRFVRVPYIVAEKDVHSLNSQFGVTWRGINRSPDRELGIAGSELIVLDLKSNEVLAIRRGFKRTGAVRNLTGVWWLTGHPCPKLDKKPDHAFIGEVLKPSYDGKVKEK
jgi:hypothetical protein